MESKKLNKVTLSDEELMRKCREWIDKIFEIKDAAKFLNIPSDYDNDPDVLFFELIRRYKKLGELVGEIESMMLANNAVIKDNKFDLSKHMGKGKGFGSMKVGGAVDIKSENGKKMKNYLEKQKK